MYQQPNIRRALPNTPVSATLQRNMTKGISANCIVPSDGFLIGRTSYGTTIRKKEEHYERTVSMIRPFTIRYQDDQWQMYLPIGCVSVNGKSCTPTNDHATDADGKEHLQWYKIGDGNDPDDKYGNVGTEGGFVCKEWTAYVLIKPYQRFTIHADSNGGQTEDDERWQWGEAVGLMMYAEIGDTEQRGAIRMIDYDSISRENKDESPFSIYWKLEDESSASSSVKLYVRNCNITIGRDPVETTAETTEVTDWDEVWVHISHSADDFSLEVVKTDSTTDEDNTYIKIYDLQDVVITGDYRRNLTNLEFYSYTAES